MGEITKEESQHTKVIIELKHYELVEIVRTAVLKQLTGVIGCKTPTAFSFKWNADDNDLLLITITIDYDRYSDDGPYVCTHFSIKDDIVLPTADTENS